jgi:hypothetical protein
MQTRINSAPLTLFYHHRNYQWTLQRKKGKARATSEHFPKWIWVSGELPIVNFVLARSNKITTAARSHVNKLPSLKNFRPAFATIVDNPGITPINGPNPRRNKPHPQRQGSKANKSHHNKKPNIQVKQGQCNFIGIVRTREHLSLSLAIICCLWTTHRGLVMVMLMLLDALSYPC